MDIKHHDAVLAATSHLPHVLAFALVDLLARKDEQDEIFKYAAGGFKDFTRIASSDPGMWLDICLANKIEIVKLIQQFQGELENITQILEQNDRKQLFDIFSNAKNARQHFLKLYEK
jgi:prephenate dehydrogenase